MWLTADDMSSTLFWLHSSVYHVVLKMQLRPTIIMTANFDNTVYANIYGSGVHQTPTLLSGKGYASYACVVLCIMRLSSTAVAIMRQSQMVTGLAVVQCQAVVDVLCCNNHVSEQVLHSKYLD